MVRWLLADVVSAVNDLASGAAGAGEVGTVPASFVALASAVACSALRVDSFSEEIWSSSMSVLDLIATKLAGGYLNLADNWADHRITAQLYAAAKHNPDSPRFGQWFSSLQTLNWLAASFVPAPHNSTTVGRHKYVMMCVRQVTAWNRLSEGELADLRSMMPSYDSTCKVAAEAALSLYRLIVNPQILKLIQSKLPAPVAADLDSINEAAGAKVVFQLLSENSARCPARPIAWRTPSGQDNHFMPAFLFEDSASSGISAANKKQWLQHHFGTEDLKELPRNTEAEEREIMAECFREAEAVHKAETYEYLMNLAIKPLPQSVQTAR